MKPQAEGASLLSWRDGVGELRVQARAPRAALESYRLGRLARRAHPGPAAAADREDLVPSSAPFPKARYCFLIASIPERHGGRTAAILDKARLFKERAGVDCEIVMTDFPGDLDSLTATLRDRGALVPGVALRRLQDYDEDRDRHRWRRVDRLSRTRRIHRQLDRMVGDDRVFLSVEGRNIDRPLLAYRNPNVQQVFVVHNAHLEPPYRDVQRILRGYRPLMLHHASAGAVVFLTNAQREDMERIVGRQDHFVVIPHPTVSAAPEKGVERVPALVVMLARLHHQKRVEDAIEAFARVVQRVPDARLEIYGHGPEEQVLQQEIERLELGSSITLAGYTDDPGKVLQRASLSLLTSRYEGFALVLSESLSSGCPPVSYDVKYGPSELISHGVNGVLVEDGDTEAIAQEVIRLLTDHELWQQLSRAAPASVDRLRPDGIVHRWSALFNGLASATWGPH